MLYLLGEILFSLACMAILGFAFGWFIRGLHEKKRASPYR